MVRRRRFRDIRAVCPTICLYLRQRMTPWLKYATSRNKPYGSQRSYSHGRRTATCKRPKSDIKKTALRLRKESGHVDFTVARPGQASSARFTRYPIERRDARLVFGQRQHLSRGLIRSVQVINQSPTPSGHQTVTTVWT